MTIFKKTSASPWSFVPRPLPARSVHAQWEEVANLRRLYNSMNFEEQQRYLIRQLRDFTDPSTQKLTYYYEKVIADGVVCTIC